jgi:hypothetical protein
VTSRYGAKHAAGSRLRADPERATEEELTEDGKDAAAVCLGKRGGEARAKSLSAPERSKIARKAAKMRWKNR